MKMPKTIIVAIAALSIVSGIQNREPETRTHGKPTIKQVKGIE